MTDRELCDIIERVRVECSQHRDTTYSLGGIYALDTIKPLLRAALTPSAKPTTLREWAETNTCSEVHEGTLCSVCRAASVGCVRAWALNDTSHPPAVEGTDAGASAPPEICSRCGESHHYSIACREGWRNSPVHLLDALQDRLGPSSGHLIRSKPIAPAKEPK